MRRRALTAGLVATATAAALVLTGTAAADAATVPTAIPRSKPTWLAQAKKVGTPAAATKVTARVYLAPKGGLDSLKAAALAVSTPGSATYGRFLSVSQYQKAYGVPASTVSSVSSYLKNAGFSITKVGADNRFLSISGTTASANRAFGANIQRYTRDGKSVQAPSAALTIPKSLFSAVTSITGLDTSKVLMKPSTATTAPPSPGFRNAKPCAISYDQVKAVYKADFKTKLPTFQGKTLSYAPCGYTGPQFRSAYEGDTALDGTGVSVGILDAYASPTIAKDANTYAVNHGDGAYAKGQLTQTTPTAYTLTGDDECGASGWFGEETLDVEAVHAMAPGANIHYYAASSCQDSDFLDAIATIVKQNKVSIVSNSWGDAGENADAASVNAYDQVLSQAALQGISFLFSSGDSGDELENTGIKQADFPASDPLVTAVGGTSTAIGAGGVLTSQTGWGTVKYTLSADGKSWVAPAATDPFYLYGAGGGSSALFNKPAYQSAIRGNGRQVPDVAMDADPNTGMLVGQTQAFSDGNYYDEYRIGGTSLASPLFAGMTALSLQNAKHKAGLLNPTIYSKSKGAFTDVTGKGAPLGDVRVDYVNGENADDGLTYSVRTFGQDGTLAVTKGYDQVTGVGVPKPSWFNALK